MPNPHTTTSRRPNKIIEGLKDAIAYAKGDKSKGSSVTISSGSLEFHTECAFTDILSMFSSGPEKMRQEISRIITEAEQRGAEQERRIAADSGK